MEITLEILKLLLPAVLTLLTVWIVLRSLMKKETGIVETLLASQRDQSRLEALKENNKTILPIRLQAYERMTLFCSRMEIGKLVTNTQTYQNMSAQAYKNALIAQIEEEFNHNVAQQVYMTDDLWNIIILAKKEVTQIFSKLYEEVEAKSGDEPASAKLFLDHLVAYLQENPQIGYVQALRAIKKEVGILF